MIIRRSERDLEANPLTRLPGNISITNEFQNHIDKKNAFAIGYLDLDKFKAYNDKYGFEHGDEAIRETARIMLGAVHEYGNSDDFVGHIGGDDFVFITTLDKAEEISRKIIEEFEKRFPPSIPRKTLKTAGLWPMTEKANCKKLTFSRFLSA